MGHGLEGVMYNALCGQSVEFTIIAKERMEGNGQKYFKWWFYLALVLQVHHLPLAIVLQVHLVLSSSQCGGSTFSTSTSSAPFGSARSRGNNGRQFGADRWPYVVSSICFSTGKHLCKANLLGHIQEGFSFGIISSSRGSHGTLDKLGKWWVWNSKLMKNLLSSSKVQIQESTITNCAGNDIIEMYLDCDAGTLVMYNQRTKQSEHLAWS
ncbi:hypothetical protein OS493_010374 [Desmophyllum pertusum]|uniref:Uncharacterized protein n=1 Tax=Desmophyllum pertusum TaxID=174260 RepID=A0A9X0A3E7_9CNID|nr:hypothetical protein OS493_010374 [Desmophyllum pertusum]